MTTNREVFDQIAESWYRVRHWPLLKRRVGCFGSKMAKREAAKYRLCTRTGLSALSVEGFELWGLDSSPAMLRQGYQVFDQVQVLCQLSQLADAVVPALPR